MRSLRHAWLPLLFLSLVYWFSVACNSPAPAPASAGSAPAPDTLSDPGPDFDPGASPFPMRSQSIHLQKGIDLTLRIPAGYHIGIAYEGLDRLRFLCRSPDHRLFATDLFDISDNKEGKVYFFTGWDPVSRQFANVHTYLDSLHNPNQVAFYNDHGKEYIYVAETGKLTRYPYHAGDTVPSGKPQVIATFPDYGLDYKYGGWHLTRSLAFHDHKLYVSVGSSCNACIEKEEVRASIVEMDPDGGHQRLFATGLRNSVGIRWVGDNLWATYMGRDLIGPDRPQDLFERVEKGKFYGWPYYIQYQDSVHDDTAMQRAARERHLVLPKRPAPAWCGFRAHSAPLGFDYFAHFEDTLLSNSFLVALHGSTDASLRRGNAIVKITGRNTYVPVVDGFLTGRRDRDRQGRPCDVLMDTHRSFFFTDDLNGVLYYVWKD
ncbi:MAG: PQQ-dependent sugar dehydrogenase [Bacteroidota bacterium]|nr:PQQ-dependent sugar dehydrogenase [Bacteroidota bacterium]MDP4258468.1 PQQ-dependent sugar dehydrogenase [Bacteroidota bacterium]